MNSLLFKLHRSYSIPLTWLAKFSWVESEHNASVESNCAQVPPPPPGPLRGICVPCQSLAWRGALANFAFGRAFAFPASTPLVTNKAKKVA